MQENKQFQKKSFGFEFSKIKNQNWFFSVTYSETGNAETYTDILNWSEIENPKQNIEIKKMVVLGNSNTEKMLSQLETENIINLLNFHNKKLQNEVQ